MPGYAAPMLGAEAYYDAGDRSIEDGPMDEITTRMNRLSPGQTLEIRATEANAAEELSTWCQLAGHEFVIRQQDRYLVRRKG